MTHGIFPLSLAACLTLAGCSSDDSAPAAGSSDSVEQTTGANQAATSMTFFTSSVPGPDGGNFGGLSGADAFCQQLADAVSSGRTWQALLSTSTVNARERMGAGPWVNAAGSTIAATTDALFAAGVPQDTVNTAGSDQDTKRMLLLDETGSPISAMPNYHDILTGSNQAGMVEGTAHCNDWTSGSADDFRAVGHSDSRGPQGADSSLGWMSAHAAPNQGCDSASFQATGGNGQIYCFATN
jgi:hypothetical protein